jgi:hypothetical protein
MSLPIKLLVNGIISRQSLLDDTVTYSLEGTLLGVPVSVTATEILLSRVEHMLGGGVAEPEESVREKEVSTQEPYPPGYDVGSLEDL